MVDEDKNLGEMVVDRETEQGARFTISVHDNGYYQVSIPNYYGGEVVTAEALDALVALARVVYHEGYLRPVEEMVSMAADALALAGVDPFIPNPEDERFCNECGLLRVDH